MSLKQNIPSFKKKIVSFMSKEDGKISKEKLIKAGILAAVFSFAVASQLKQTAAAGHDDHTNSGHNSFDPPTRCGIPVPNLDHGANEVYGPDHENIISFSDTAGVATGTHKHCVHTGHVSHDSHNHHGSGGWC
jgi:hypothetical protein